MRWGVVGLVGARFFSLRSTAAAAALNPQRKKPTPTALQFHPQKKFHFHFFCWIPFQLAAGRWAPWGGLHGSSAAVRLRYSPIPLFFFNLISLFLFSINYSFHS